jgi:hypothetical protein
MRLRGLLRRYRSVSRRSSPQAPAHWCLPQRQRARSHCRRSKCEAIRIVSAHRHSSVAHRDTARGSPWWASCAHRCTGNGSKKDTRRLPAARWTDHRQQSLRPHHSSSHRQPVRYCRYLLPHPRLSPRHDHRADPRSRRRRAFPAHRTPRTPLRTLCLRKGRQPPIRCPSPAQPS